MSAGTKPARNAGALPRSRARMAGVFQALEGLTFTYGQVIVLGRLVVSGNAPATAANILAHEGLFRFGFASTLVGVGCHIVWAVLFYYLFKPVSRRLSLLAASVILVGCAVQALTSVLYLAPLLVLQGSSGLAALTAEQTYALAFTFLKLNGLAFDTYLVFFGLWCFLIGWLIFRSTFLPGILGVLLAIDGAGWMLYVSPPFANHVFPVIAVAAGIAEIPLLLWLLIRGVDERRWKEQAAASGEFL